MSLSCLEVKNAWTFPHTCLQRGAKFSTRLALHEVIRHIWQSVI